MVRFLQFVFADWPLKALAVVTAVLIWFTAVLDRTYLTDVTVPVILDRVETEKLISEFETREAIVTMEGKGKDLIGLRLKQPAFRLVVPEARAGVQKIKLAASDLRLPDELVVRSINPEQIELRLSEVSSRRVAVEVPARGEPGKGLTITKVKPLSRVKLIGPEEDIHLHATVFTESLDLGAVRSNDTLFLRVIAPEGSEFAVKPESIPVAVSVEKEGARIFLGVPVGVVAPDSMQVTVIPDEAQIAVAGPEGKLDELKPDQIQARIKISALQPGRHRLAAEIILPPGLHLVKCEPALFGVVIE